MEYDKGASTQKKFQNILIDFRFELMFRHDKELYKKFLNAFLYGDGIYAPFEGKTIHLTRTSIKKASPVKDSSLMLPKDWMKFVRIVDND